jgi:hypothetical protein
MSLEQLSFLAQIISALAVVGSLIFVGVQLRQATAAIRGSTSQAHSDLYTQLVQSVVDDADFAQIWGRGITKPEELADADWVRFVAYASALFRLWESSRVQWLNRRLDAEHWQTIEQQVIHFAPLPGIQAAWKLRGRWHSPAFQKWLESFDSSSDVSLYGRASVGSAPGTRAKR